MTYQPGHLYRVPYPFESSRGEKHRQAKLTFANVCEIRRRAEAGEDHVALANEFGVGKNYVRLILRRKVRVLW